MGDDDLLMKKGTYMYRIAGNFRGRKCLRIGEKYDLHGEHFRKLLACATPMDTTPPTFTENTFANSHKTVNFVKVFSLKSFPLYSMYMRNQTCTYVFVNTRLCEPHCTHSLSMYNQSRASKEERFTNLSVTTHVYSMFVLCGFVICDGSFQSQHHSGRQIFCCLAQNIAPHELLFEET